MAKDIGHVIAQFNRIVTKSQVSMKKSLMLALQDLPPEKQIRELNKVAKEMDKIHKAVTRLAVTRGVAETKKEKDRRIGAEVALRPVLEKMPSLEPRRCTEIWSNAV